MGLWQPGEQCPAEMSSEYTDLADGYVLDVAS